MPTRLDCESRGPSTRAPFASSRRASLGMTMIFEYLAICDTHRSVALGSPGGAGFCGGGCVAGGGLRGGPSVGSVWLGSTGAGPDGAVLCGTDGSSSSPGSRSVGRFATGFGLAASSCSRLRASAWRTSLRSTSFSVRTIFCPSTFMIFNCTTSGPIKRTNCTSCGGSPYNHSSYALPCSSVSRYLLQRPPHGVDHHILVHAHEHLVVLDGFFGFGRDGIQISFGGRLAAEVEYRVQHLFERVGRNLRDKALKGQDQQRAPGIVGRSIRRSCHRGGTRHAHVDVVIPFLLFHRTAVELKQDEVFGDPDVGNGDAVAGTDRYPDYPHPLFQLVFGGRSSSVLVQGDALGPYGKRLTSEGDFRLQSADDVEARLLRHGLALGRRRGCGARGLGVRPRARGENQQDGDCTLATGHGSLRGAGL